MHTGATVAENRLDSIDSIQSRPVPRETKKIEKKVAEKKIYKFQVYDKYSMLQASLERTWENSPRSETRKPTQWRLTLQLP